MDDEEYIVSLNQYKIRGKLTFSYTYTSMSIIWKICIREFVCSCIIDHFIIKLYLKKTHQMTSFAIIPLHYNLLFRAFVCCSYMNILFCRSPCKCGSGQADLAAQWFCDYSCNRCKLLIHMGCWWNIARSSDDWILPDKHTESGHRVVDGKSSQGIHLDEVRNLPQAWIWDFFK